MEIIYKYQLACLGSTDIELPLGAEILTAQIQGNSLCIWVKVNPEAPMKTQSFFVLGTGIPFEITGLNYISTV